MYIAIHKWTLLPQAPAVCSTCKYPHQLQWTYFTPLPLQRSRRDNNPGALTRNLSFQPGLKFLHCPSASFLWLHASQHVQGLRQGGGSGSCPQATAAVLPWPGEVLKLADGGWDHMQCLDRRHQQGASAGAASSQEPASTVEGKIAHIWF